MWTNVKQTESSKFNLNMKNPFMIILKYISSLYFLMQKESKHIPKQKK